MEDKHAGCQLKEAGAISDIWRQCCVIISINEDWCIWPIGAKPDLWEATFFMIPPRWHLQSAVGSIIINTLFASCMSFRKEIWCNNPAVCIKSDNDLSLLFSIIIRWMIEMLSFIYWYLLPKRCLLKMRTCQVNQSIISVRKATAAWEKLSLVPPKYTGLVGFGDVNKALGNCHF